jgi:hypothetical protein
VHLKESARQPHWLPCVFSTTHGKVFFKKMMLNFVQSVEEEKILCGALWRKRTTNKIFVVHFISGTRQSFIKNDASFVRRVEEEKYFAVHFISGAWLRACLPCVFSLPSAL